MVGRRKILLRLLHPEGYTGCTADTIIKKLSISLFQQNPNKQNNNLDTNTWPEQIWLPTKKYMILPTSIPSPFFFQVKWIYSAGFIVL